MHDTAHFTPPRSLPQLWGHRWEMGALCMVTPAIKAESIPAISGPQQDHRCYSLTQEQMVLGGRAGALGHRPHNSLMQHGHRWGGPEPGNTRPLPPPRQATTPP
ncbi:hypothetical protein KIL84_005212 [Mauremys mutica]|uniref:Uncharacterized protein n=1 Tax=Mauremys mutica TaxID=74926 RepID=A0A9D4B5M1_9SAUR|nr:hypothetical protein KIL84_005212 [Mauremys mutica]